VTDERWWLYDILRAESFPTFTDANTKSIDTFLAELFPPVSADLNLLLSMEFADSHDVLSTTEDNLNLLISQIDESVGFSAVEEFSASYLWNLDETIPVPSEDRFFYDSIFLSELLFSPTDAPTMSRYFEGSETFIGPNDSQVKFIEIRLGEAFPTPADSPAIGRSLSFVDTFVPPVDSNLRYEFAYIEDEDDSFFIPDLDNQTNHSFVVDSRLNTKNTFWKRKIRDELINIDLT